MLNSAVDTLHIYVDEAGDPALFTNRRRAIVGTRGCSRHFNFGKLKDGEPTGLGHLLETLSWQLPANPYLGGTPSFGPERRTFFNGQQALSLEGRFGEQKRRKP